MTLNLKYFFFISVGLVGCYFFNQGYEKLIFPNNELLNNKFSFQNIEDKKENLDVELNEILEKNIEKKSKLKLNKIEIIVKEGNTFFSILNNFNLTDKLIFEIINEIEKFLDLKKLKTNDKIYFYQNDNNEIKKIEFNLDIENKLILNIDNEIYIKKKKLDKKFYEISKEFIIFESLYSDGIKNKLPQDILIKLIKMFSFDLDFQRDIRKNTKVSVSYEYNEIIETNKIEYKDINYAQITIGSNTLEYFKFLTDAGYYDYFNREGKNVKKSILKTPLDGARLSSNFGMRKHPISGYNKMHKGVDFAAPKGTPIYAGGNGVIEFVGTNGGYGKYIRIRHNNEYKTAYAHLSKFNKGITKGARVNQGDVIGFVGSTGISTGPHLHYEILFQNKHINPLKLKLPSGKILEGKELKRFKKSYKEILANHLNLLYE